MPRSHKNAAEHRGACPVQGTRYVGEKFRKNKLKVPEVVMHTPVKAASSVVPQLSAGL